MIWREQVTLEQLNTAPPSLASLVGIEFTEIGENWLAARMPVDQRTHQPAGIMHGGASVVLAETLGSVASNLIVDRNKAIVVGLEVNANHLRPVSSGFVTGVCTPIHLGAKTHVWDIKISNEAGKLVCISRLTVAVLAK